jgi:hemoglobin/transferrin/lactoferrin receptor protein
MKIFRIVAVAAVVLLLARSAAAGEIVGTAVDPSGAVLASARVSLHNLVTGVEVSTSSDKEGKFAFPGVSAGRYVVSVSFEGFTSSSRTVEVSDAANPPALLFKLAPGSVDVGVTVTATRGERDALLIPLRAQSITRDQIAQQAPPSTGDALLASASITPVGSGPMEVRPRLRGLDSTRLLILVDGERLNNARTATDRSGTEVGLADLSTVGSLEIVGGAGSVLYGTDALAGTINIITNPLRFSDGLKLNYGVDTLYSTNERGRRGSATFGLSNSRMALQVAGTVEEFGDYRAGGGHTEDTRPYFASGVLKQQDTIDTNFGFHFNAFPDPFNSPYVRTSSTIPTSSARGNNINASGMFALGSNQTLTVKYIRRRIEDAGFPDFAAPTFFQRVSLPFNNLDRISARYEARDLAPWLANVKVSAYFQDQNRLLRNEFPVQFPVPSPGFFPISVYQLHILSDTQQHVRTPGLDLQATLLATRQHVVTLGGTVYSDRSADNRTSVTQTTIIGNVDLGPMGPQANVFSAPVVLGPASTTHPVRVPDATFANIGVFVQDEWDLTKFFRIVAGLRYDHYRVSTEPTPGYSVASVTAGANPALDPSTIPSVNGDRISRNSVTGDFGVVFRPNDHLSVLARYGRSYRHPNLEELLFSGPATVGAIAPNVKVGPEKGDNFDVGVKYRASRYAASLSYYNNTYRGFISTEIVTTTPAGPLSQAINFTNVRIQGVESDLDIPVVFRAGVLTFSGAAAYIRGQVLSGTNPLSGASLAGTPQDNISPFKGLFAVRFNDARDRFWLEYGARVQAKVTRVAPTLRQSPFLIAQDLLSLDGFTIHRLAWGIHFNGAGTGRLGLTFAIENLFDKYYREQFQFAPARGRTLTMTLRVRNF